VISKSDGKGGAAGQSEATGKPKKRNRGPRDKKQQYTKKVVTVHKKKRRERLEKENSKGRTSDQDKLAVQSRGSIAIVPLHQKEVVKSFFTGAAAPKSEPSIPRSAASETSIARASLLARSDSFFAFAATVV